MGWGYDLVMGPDPAAAIRDHALRVAQPIRFMANKLNASELSEYREKLLTVRMHEHLTGREGAIFPRWSSVTQATSPRSSRSGHLIDTHKCRVPHGAPCPARPCAEAASVSERAQRHTD